MVERKELWKAFEQIELTHSATHHLLAIQALIDKNGYARGVDISRYLNITRGSVSITIKTLKEKGYVSEDSNKFYYLTEKGLSIVSTVLHKRNVIRMFYQDVLQLSPEKSESEACKTEHLISQLGSQRLSHFLQYFNGSSDDARIFRDSLSVFFKNECPSWEKNQ